MPVTKQKLIRHYALDRCLRNQTRRYYIEDLLAECNKALEAKDCHSQLTNHNRQLRLSNLFKNRSSQRMNVDA